MSGDLLTTVVAAARRAAGLREPASAPDLERLSASRRPHGAEFQATLCEPGIRIIAECKRRSPSRGILRQQYDPVAIAQGYARSGAAAVSVLTEPTFFDGSLDHLRAVRGAVDLPLLRKDFIVTEFQVLEARAAGADAVLLIVAALDDQTLARLIAYSTSLELAALVEVHDREELVRALSAGAALVGVNSRNLRTLELSAAVFDLLAPEIPQRVIAVAESGLKTADDLHRLHALRYDAFLIGERFMATPDPGRALQEFVAARPARSQP